jgi:hypothetical protein
MRAAGILFSAGVVFLAAAAQVSATTQDSAATRLSTTSQEPAAAQASAAPQEPAGAQESAAPQEPAGDQAGEQASQTAAPPRPTEVHYRPPTQSRALDESAEARPLLAALRETGNGLADREWSRRTSREIGTSLITDQYGRFYERERVQRLMEDFREGYVQVFVRIPEVVSLTAVEMANEESAADFYRLNLEVLQMQLDGTNESEEGHVEILREGDLTLAGLDQAYEKRYELLVGDLPPSRFLVLFGRTGRHMMTATFLQSDIDEATARGLLGSMAVKLRALSAGE